MSRLRKSINARDQHIFSLRVCIGVLVLFCVGLIYGWSRAPDNITIHNPPDLRTGSTRNINDIHPANIYAFGLYIFQQLNRWPTNGTVDYEKNIKRLSCFMTPAYEEKTKNHYGAKKANFELTSRSRSVQEIPGQGYSDNRVYIESASSWVVYLDLQVKETLKGKEIKNSLVRYPINIVKYDVNPECNPWGLALDGYRENPTKLHQGERG